MEKKTLPDSLLSRRLSRLFDRFQAECRRRAWSEETVHVYRKRLERFLAWLAEAEPTTEEIQQITRATLSAFHQSLYDHVTKKGKPYQATTRKDFLVALKSFFAWCQKEGVILADPALSIEYPKEPVTLPRSVATLKEMRRLLRQPDLSTYVGLRDRAMLELLYTSGVRNSECRRLTVDDLDLVRGYATVRRGKGQKDRVVPIGKTAAHYVGLYLAKARPQLVAAAPSAKQATRVLFLSLWGLPFSIGAVCNIVKRYTERARIGKHLTPHALRHTCATQMLEGHADIRYIQEMLGHESLKSTQRYTKVEIGDLKKVHERCHPRERDARRLAGDPVDSLDTISEQGPCGPRTPGAPPAQPEVSATP
jgi:integrase/recombinase XerD